MIRLGCIADKDNIMIETCLVDDIYDNQVLRVKYKHGKEQSTQMINIKHN